jgi:hypothetical protein
MLLVSYCTKDISKQSGVTELILDRHMMSHRDNNSTYLLHGAVLLEKLTGLQLVKKFPAMYGTQRFITAFISAVHFLYSEPAQSSPYPHILLFKEPT